MVRSRVYLPKLESPPATIVEYLTVRFPHVPRAVWLDRIARGLVTTKDGIQLRDDSAYHHGLTVFYQREVRSEPEPPETETILYRDQELLAADKPHGMPVTPAGDYVERSLLFRLQRRTGLDTVAPLHRLDRDTAGIVLFSVNVDSRSVYSDLFAKRLIEREYYAVAHVGEMPEEECWHIENRLGGGTPWFRRQIVEGPPNAITDIELLDAAAGLGRFRLRPKTGRKHQLRVHMASIGFPILGDALYPELRDRNPADPPLQLLAARLSFIDPLNGSQRRFVSARPLDGAGVSP